MSNCHDWNVELEDPPTHKHQVDVSHGNFGMVANPFVTWKIKRKVIELKNFLKKFLYKIWEQKYILSINFSITQINEDSICWKQRFA